MKILKKEKGFTLLEMLVVVTIIGILSFFTSPVFTRTLKSIRLQGAARKISSSVRLARRYAVMYKTDVYLEIDITNDKITIESTEGDMDILAPKGEITIRSKNLVIETEEDTKINSGNMKTETKQNFEIQSANIKQEAKSDLKSKAMNVTAEATVEHKIKGLNTTVEAGINNQVKGSLVTVEASGINTIKGALVKIN